MTAIKAGRQRHSNPGRVESGDNKLVRTKRGRERDRER